MALEDLSGNLQSKFGGNPGNKLLGTNAGTFQKFSIPAIIVNGVRRELLTLDNLEDINGPQKTSNIDKDGNPIGAEIGGRSFLGTAVLDYLEFPKAQYADINDPTKLIFYNPVRINEVIFSVSREKKIIETLTVGSQHSIKEYIASGDYRITAECVIIGETEATDPGGHFTISSDEDVAQSDVSSTYRKKAIGNIFPHKDMTSLHNILAAPSAIRVNSRLLNDIFGIKNVVVLTYDFKQERGANNYQLLTITMVSDESPELKGKDDTKNEGN